MANSNVDPSCYIMKIGKYRNMLDVDVVDLQTVKKWGNWKYGSRISGIFMQTRLVSPHLYFVQSIIDEYLEEQYVPELKEIEHPKKTRAKVKQSDLIVTYD